MNVRAEVDILNEVKNYEDDEVLVIGSKKRPHFLGPIDKFALAIALDSSNKT